MYSFDSRLLVFVYGCDAAASLFHFKRNKIFFSLNSIHFILINADALKSLMKLKHVTKRNQAAQRGHRKSVCILICLVRIPSPQWLSQFNTIYVCLSNGIWSIASRALCITSSVICAASGLDAALWSHTVTSFSSLFFFLLLLCAVFHCISSKCVYWTE